ncbi:hypothetical protein RJI07_01650 [Mycoplasmatota bacterium WC30]
MKEYKTIYSIPGTIYSVLMGIVLLACILGLYFVYLLEDENFIAFLIISLIFFSFAIVFLVNILKNTGIQITISKAGIRSNGVFQKEYFFEWENICNASIKIMSDHFMSRNKGFVFLSNKYEKKLQIEFMISKNNLNAIKLYAPSRIIEMLD